MVNWTKIIEPYKKNLLIDLEKLLPISSIKDLETASPEPPPLDKVSKKLSTIW